MRDRGRICTPVDDTTGTNGVRFELLVRLRFPKRLASLVRFMVLGHDWASSLDEMRCSRWWAEDEMVA